MKFGVRCIVGVFVIVLCEIRCRKFIIKVDYPECGNRYGPFSVDPITDSFTIYEVISLQLSISG